MGDRMVACVNRCAEHRRQAADSNVYIESVHQLTDLGAVFTHVGSGTSREGFDDEWRMIVILVSQAEGPNRCELFDEADLEAALARFDELSRTAPRDI
ncbi:hypothetical protein [Mycolicibacterium sp. 120270]|uniref:hypothetical protein n=1 Tax=Mycolicibacterium sp. 120270 TaxID=3090600 RepID=UPI00299E227A|nr:hypothetical protein [Mycolicibacterium sp. 120270]MDX1881908.1 hypothetical protein [Mycolicibacterium sp. 120270]